MSVPRYLCIYGAHETSTKEILGSLLGSGVPHCQQIMAPSSRELEHRLSGPHLLSVDMEIKLPTDACQASQSRPMLGILFPYSSYSFHPWSPVPAEAA